MSEQTTRLTVALADHYRIERELGQGGMATVYLAHDLKHDRDVAIKVLHQDLGAALGADRFLGEIRTTARLQHPHILPLLDSGDAGGLLYYVMPVVTGESLRERLTRERQLPITDAVRIAREVASALGYAHRQGVIHRDIKPENVLLHDGQALVADFGIALAVQAAGGARMTQTGLSLGTPQYMSPEQAMGERTIDARSDVYALGAVTYEMLTGDPPFTGSTVQAIVAKILSTDAERLTLIRKTIPAHVEDAVLTALARLPADRFATAAEFAAALDNGSGTTRRMTRTTDARVSRASRVLVGAAGVTLLVAGAAVGWMARRPPVVERPRVRIVFNPDSGAPPTVHECCASSVAMSPDGRFLAYTARRAGQRVIVIRDRDGFAPKIGAAADVKHPFFSPAGTELAFVQQGIVQGGTLTPSTSAAAQPSLVRITLPDGRPSIILPLAGDQHNLTGATWLPHGSIILGRLTEPGLLRVAPERGTVEVITTPDTAAGEMRHVSPFYVAGADGVLFTIWPKTDSRADALIGFVSLRNRKVKILGHGLSPHYTAGGYLVYATSDGRIMAQKTHLPSGRVSGDVIRVAEGVSVRGSWTADFAVSRDGALVYDQGSDRAAIDLVGAGGQVRNVPIRPEGVSHWDNPRFSPDGRFVAAAGSLGGAHQLFVLDLAGNAALRLTFDGQTEFLDWTTDGRSLVYVKAGTQLARQSADRSDVEKVLWAGDGGVIGRVSVQGKWVAFAHTSPPGATGRAGSDIMVLHADSAAPRSYLATAYDEGAPTISPDGRWLAYVSTESGRSEVYVAAFPFATAGRHAVSSDGGNEPQWSADGRTLYYRARTTGSLMSQEIRTSPALTLGALRQVSNDLYERSEDGADYDVDPKGGRFVMTTIRTEGSRLTWILNAVPDR